MLRRVIDDPSIEKMLRDPEDVMDLVLDAGKPPVIHFRNDRPVTMMACEPLRSETVHRLVSLLPKMTQDRCYLPERPTDRIAVIRGYDGMPTGISWRFATATVPDLPEAVQTYLEAPDTGSVLVFGKPGCGKTTVLRSMIRCCADIARYRVMVVDPYGEMGLPQNSMARQMMLYPGSSTETLMEQAIRYHSPEVLVVDEIVTRNESRAALHAGLRGIRLLASCHARSVSDLIHHPVMRDLVGSTQSAAISDSASKQRGSKFVTERRQLPLFQAAYDVERDLFMWDLKSDIDSLLNSKSYIS
jgi:stage III sporulation protein AA